MTSKVWFLLLSFQTATGGFGVSSRRNWKIVGPITKFPCWSALSPLLLLFSFFLLSLSLSPSISASPSAAVVVVCLLCSSYRLDRLAYSLVPAAPRFPHRLQRCCSSSITLGASSLVSTDLGGDRIRSTFFLSLCPFLYRLLPVRENEVPQQRLIITK